MAEVKRDQIDEQLCRLIGRQMKLTQQGYWIGNYLFGFTAKKQQDTTGNGKKRTILVPDENEDKYIREMYRLRAEGILDDKQIVKKINEMGYKSRVRNKWSKDGKCIGQTPGKKLTEKKLNSYLRMTVYAGVLKKSWTRNLPIQAQFDGLVNLETWNKANRGKVYLKELGNNEYEWVENLDTKMRVKTQMSDQYPYKHVIKCPHCNNVFWASASKGKSGKKFPAYHCSGDRNKKPKHKHYGVPAEEFNSAVEGFVNRLVFTKEYFAAFELVLKDVYQKKHKNQIDVSQKKAEEIKEMRVRLKNLYEKLEQTTKSVVYRNLEEKIEKLDNEIKDAEVVRNKSEATEHDFVAYSKHARHLLEHPGQILLKTRKKEDQQAIWSLVFEELPTYEEITTGTPKLSLCFNVKNTLSGASDGIVVGEGISHKHNFYPRPPNFENHSVFNTSCYVAYYVTRGCFPPRG